MKRVRAEYRAHTHAIGEHQRLLKSGEKTSEIISEPKGDANVVSGCLIFFTEGDPKPVVGMTIKEVGESTLPILDPPKKDPPKKKTAKAKKA